MKRLAVYITAVGLLSAAACKPKYDETSPKMAPVTEAIFASGTIEPKDAYIISAYSDGFLVKSYVTENDIVLDKQLLFRLDNRQQNTQVKIAQNNLEYARVNAAANSPTLLQIKAQIDAARIKMQNDSVNLGRYEKLFATNSVSKQDLDNSRLNYQTSLSSYRATLESYRISAEKVKQELANTQSQLQNAEAGNQFFELAAIGRGKVYQIFKKQGDLVRKGEQVAQLGNPDSIVINLNIDEASISKVKEGQKALIELNTEKNKTYEARISKIYPHFNDAAQSYRVEARFVNEMPGVISGTQLQANIITNQKEKAMLINHAFIVGDNKVIKKTDKKLDTITVTTGIASYDWIEITSGLNMGDVIVKQK